MGVPISLNLKWFPKLRLIKVEHSDYTYNPHLKANQRKWVFSDTFVRRAKKAVYGCCT